MTFRERLRAIANSWRTTHKITGRPINGTIIEVRFRLQPEGHGYIDRLTTDGATYVDLPCASAKEMDLAWAAIMRRGREIAAERGARAA
jgi:hypothetical protein